jgi:response regulator RpfG family c-di-GMP phosphodiesterase
MNPSRQPFISKSTYLMRLQCQKLLLTADLLVLAKPTAPRIVLVDDTDWILDVIEMVIRHKFKNVTVQKFLDSNEAWQELQWKEPDLLITRDKMPGLTGEEIVQGLVHRRVSYPIIVGGGWPPTEDWVREYTVWNPNITYLCYPFTPAQLYEKLSAAGFCPAPKPARMCRKISIRVPTPLRICRHRNPRRER